MGATMLAGAAALITALPQQAMAQHVIENDDVVVPGDRPDPWNIGNSLIVGDFGDSTLTISDGAVVSSTSGFVGRRAGSTGAVTVTGAGSRWNNPGEIRIGGLGAGTLTILEGGSVHSGIGYIAYETGSTATVSVSGAGSEWISTSTLMVGGSGSANMTISDGGLVQNVRGELGVDTPAVSSSVLVTGAGSQWINTDALRIGLFGTGALTIADGGEVSAAGVNLGMFAAGNGTLNFGAAAGDAAVAAGTLDTPTIAFGPGTGTIVFNHTSNDFELDADISGNGTVRILSGRTTLNGNSTYGGDTFFDGGTIALGSDSALGTSTLTVTGAFQQGRPALRAEGAARTVNNDIVFDRPGALPFAAYLTLDATTHALTLNGDMSGSGIVDIQGGSDVTTTGAISDGLSLQLGSNSRLRAEGGVFADIFAEMESVLELGDGVSAVSSIFAIGNFTLQTAADESAALAGGISFIGGGTITLAGGGLTVNSNISGANGAVNVTGGNITLGGSNTFDGGLNVSGGSLTLAHANALPSGNVLTLTNDGAVTANHALTLGGLNMSEDSTLVLNQSATINSAGTHIMAGVLSGAGGLTFNGGGHFVLSGNNTYTGNTLLEGGTLTLDGGSVALGAGQDFYVGRADGDNATLQIMNGGSVSNRTGRIGDAAGSTGTVTVTGAGSQWINSSTLAVGQSGAGTLTIADGATVSNLIGNIAVNAGSTGEVTVTGADSFWNNSVELRVANSGTGTLTIADGGRVHSTEGFLGFNASGSGAVTITGAGSTWTILETLNVGRFGTGTLTISDGGHVSAEEFVIAASGSATGTLNFGAAAGDAAVAAGTLSTPDIQFGVGTSTIVFNHTDDNFQLATRIIGNGTVRILSGRTTLSGNNTYTGSTLLEGGTLTLGHNNALGGSTLRTTGSVVDYANGVNIANSIIIDSNTTQFQVLSGSATQSGVISENNGPRPFQKIGDGELILTAANTFTGATRVSGGTLTFDGGSLSIAGRLTASAAGSPTASIIARNGAQISTGSNLIIGEVDHGEMLIESGAEVTATDTVSIADVTGSTGLLTIDGAGSLLTASNQVWVGTNDAGAVVITNGGRIDSGAAILGAVGSGVGSVTVDGAHSQWTSSGQFTVGFNRDGELTISGGGEVSNTSGIIGSGATSNGSAIVTGAGSIWTNSSELRIGSSGTGTLTIADGGVVNSNGGLVGAEAGSSGTVTISGTGSTWNNTGALRIGRFGAGTLTVSNGGSLTSVNAIVAAQAGSSGSATVTGTGSSWTTTNYLDVGDFDTGYLTIADGGTVTSATGRLGYYPDGDGHVLVTGTGSNWTMTDLFSVGRIGAGTLTIAGGGEVRNTTGYIGEQAGSTGAAIVTGSGSGWINSGLLYVGTSGDGTLTLSDGGEVSADEVIIAHSASSTGIVYIGSDGVAPSGAGILNTQTLTFGAGTGALVFNHTNCCGLFFDADISSDPLGQAFILHAEGITHLTGNSAGFAGGVLVGGGALSVDGTLGSGGVELGVDGSGFLTGSGTVGGDVLVAGGGTLVGVSGSTLTITGDLGLAAGAQVIAALGAPGDGELFAVGGDLTLDGTLDVIDMGGFGPGLYGLFTYGGSLTDNGFAIGAAPGVLPGELQLQTSVAGEVNLVSNIGVDLLFWDGDDPANALNGVIDGGDGVWSATSFTFTDADGLVSGPSRPAPGFIVFSGAAGNVTVDGSEGGIEIAGAQFAVDGYLIDGDGITLAGNGDGDAIFRVGNGTGAGAAFTATIGSDLSGDAALVKTDLGTLTLTGHNSYTGGTEVRAGTLIGSTASVIGDIANNGVVVFDQAGDASLSQSLSGNGLFRFTGGAEFTLGSGNSYTGGTQVFGSQLVLTANNSAGTGAVTLNNSNIAYDDAITVSNTLTFSGTNELQVRSGTATHAGHVTGGGDLGLTGAGTLIFTGNGSAFTGNTIITGNVLMNGTLGGTVDVADGGVLRGFGTLGSTRLLAGSTIAPGNSVGTLTINGDLVFESGSLYEATALPDGQSDLINATGTITINGGSVLVVGTDSGFAANTNYTILSAAGGITGEFDAITSNFAFLTPNLSLTGGTLTLQLERNILDFAQFAQTRNQRSVANAADSLGAGNPVWEALVLLEEAAAPLAFEALNGEIHATHRQLVMDDTIHTRRAVSSRLAAARSEEAGSAWISGHFGGAQFGSRTGVSRASADTSGVIFGIDTPVSERARIGVMAGFGENSFSLTGRGASGSTESRSLGVYAGGQFAGFGLSAGAIYGWHDLTTRRAIIFPGFDEYMRSSHSADSVQVFGEARLAGPAGLEPFLSLAHVRLDTGGFGEAGGAAALAIDSETRQMTQGTLGTRLSHDWQTGGTNVRFDGSLGWRRVFSGHRQFVSGDLSGAPVYFEGNGVDREAAAIEAGITIEPMNRMSLELGYAGEIGSNARNHGAEFRARWAF
ncbi:autotransporter-associated beta strand repeat-containing protein [Glycocaulis sp.]|uniref:autotransporter-associated beta strand repeat-containing protein n=1 Tax=Glycocaulis sp. TaxID=1969725 RepID=UPI003F710218